MTNDQFKTWRGATGMTQDEAAKALGLAVSNIKLLERGKRYDNDRPVLIPKSVELACLNLSRRCLTENAITFATLWESIDWGDTAEVPVIQELTELARSISGVSNTKPTQEN